MKKRNLSNFSIEEYKQLLYKLIARKTQKYFNLELDITLYESADEPYEEEKKELRETTDELTILCDILEILDQIEE